MVVAALTPAENEKAIAAFQELGVCRQLAEAAASLGWKSPSSIQAQAVPHLLQGTEQWTVQLMTCFSAAWLLTKMLLLQTVTS